MIKYLGYAVTFQEVPGETSLCFNITNCQHRCAGCHSPELSQDIGKSLEKDIVNIIERYNGGITCVCFMGEGNDPEGLMNCVGIVRKKYPRLKTCLYSGENIGGNWLIHAMLCTRMLDYLKLGPYKQECGGLDNPNTNQRMYKISYRDSTYYATLDDITPKFWKKGSHDDSRISGYQTDQLHLCEKACT